MRVQCCSLFPWCDPVAGIIASSWSRDCEFVANAPAVHVLGACIGASIVVLYKSLARAHQRMLLVHDHIEQAVATVNHGCRLKIVVGSCDGQP